MDLDRGVLVPHKERGGGVMAYDEVYLVSDKLDVATDEEILAVAATLGVQQWPSGYREFVTALGAGDYTNYVRVLLPSQILTECAPCRDNWATYGAATYEEYLRVLPLDRLVESVILASTVDGDEVVFHPDDPAALYFLDINADTITTIGRTFDEALDWMCGGTRQQETVRVLDATDQFLVRDVRYFEPYADQESVRFGLQPTVAADAVRAHLVDLARDDRIGTLCLNHSYRDDDGVEQEWMQLLVRDFKGIVACYFYPEEQGGTTVVISYDRDWRTARLDSLLAYFHPLATHPLDTRRDPSLPTWDRARREWIDPTL